jgi:hypothetical protein
VVVGVVVVAVVVGGAGVEVITTEGAAPAAAVVVVVVVPSDEPSPPPPPPLLTVRRRCRRRQPRPCRRYRGFRDCRRPASRRGGSALAALAGVPADPDVAVGAVASRTKRSGPALRMNFASPAPGNTPSSAKTIPATGNWATMNHHGTNGYGCHPAPLLSQHPHRDDGDEHVVGSVADVGVGESEELIAASRGAS